MLVSTEAAKTVIPGPLGIVSLPEVSMFKVNYSTGDCKLSPTQL